MLGERSQRLKGRAHVLGDGLQRLKTRAHVLGEGPQPLKGRAHVLGEGSLRLKGRAHVLGEGSQRLKGRAHVLGEGSQRLKALQASRASLRATAAVARPTWQPSCEKLAMRCACCASTCRLGCGRTCRQKCRAERRLACYRSSARSDTRRCARHWGVGRRMPSGATRGTYDEQSKPVGSVRGRHVAPTRAARRAVACADRWYQHPPARSSPVSPAVPHVRVATDLARQPAADRGSSARGCRPVASRGSAVNSSVVLAKSWHVDAATCGSQRTTVQ